MLPSGFADATHQTKASLGLPRCFNWHATFTSIAQTCIATVLLVTV
jgi:hypothetical protein